jgi:hypothetical protein
MNSNSINITLEVTALQTTVQFCESACRAHVFPVHTKFPEAFMQIRDVFVRWELPFRLLQKVNSKFYCKFYLNESTCLNKLKDYDREYRLRNKDKLTESKRSYQIRNKDKLREYYYRNLGEYDRQYRIQNNDKLKDYGRQYRSQNREMKKDYSLRNKLKSEESARLYYFRNHDKIKESIRANYIRHLENPDTYFPRLTVFKSWKSSESVREFFESLAEKLHISHYTDWYRISMIQIRDSGGVFELDALLPHSISGSSLFSKFESLGIALRFAYPEINWELDQFSFKGKKSVQRCLKVQIESLLPGIEIIEDYQHPELSWGLFWLFYLFIYLFACCPCFN